MPFDWLTRKRATIPDRIWHESLAGMPFAARLDADEQARLRTLCDAFLARKSFSAAAGLDLTASMRTMIAIQACLPVLNLGLAGYDDFVEIIVYPDQFLVPRTLVDEIGVVHESLDALAGETMDGGPVILSWADAAPGDHVTNVTIHEFVHKLDMADGEADGIPPLPPGRRARWKTTLQAAHAGFCAELDTVERRIPRHVDPESAEADPWYAQLPLDPYAATDPAEFFAVSGEAFFTDPVTLRAAYPDWYAELATFFRQDPASAQPRPIP